MLIGILETAGLAPEEGGESSFRRGETRGSRPPPAPAFGIGGRDACGIYGRSPDG